MADPFDRLPAWSITVLDETGTKSVLRGTLATGTQADTALTALIGLIGALSAISGCVAVRASVSYRTVYLPLESPAMGSTARDEGVFALTTADNTTAVVSVPGFDRSKLSTEGCLAGFLIDLTDSDVDAFLAALLSGIWKSPFGSSLDYTISGYIREVS